jgi:hypothetical protein
MLGTLGRRGPTAMLGGTLLLAGSPCKRFAIFRAGFESARQTTNRVQTVDAQTPPPILSPNVKED